MHINTAHMNVHAVTASHTIIATVCDIICVILLKIRLMQNSYARLGAVGIKLIEKSTLCTCMCLCVCVCVNS